jgi:hypothetical protein
VWELAVMAELTALGVCGVGLYRVIFVSRPVPHDEEVSLGPDELFRIQERVKTYVTDAQVHFLVLPLVMFTLCAVVILSLAGFAHPVPDVPSVAFLLMGFIALSSGGLRALRNFGREGRRLRALELGSDIEAP